MFTHVLVCDMWLDLKVNLLNEGNKLKNNSIKWLHLCKNLELSKGITGLTRINLMFIHEMFT